MFSNIMHGKHYSHILSLCLRFRAHQTLSGRFQLCSSVNQDYDDTKFRKKPALCEGVGRILTNSSDKWKHNAWYRTKNEKLPLKLITTIFCLLRYRDNVEWGEKQVQEAEEKLKKNSSTFLQEEDVLKYENEASKFWDTFYSTHENKFFKDRHWLFTEVPELSGESIVDNPSEETQTKEFPGNAASFRILEVSY